MKPGEPDESGRRRPVPVPGSEFDLPADTVIPSIGQKITVDFTDARLLKTAPGSFETQIPNVYIGGDARLGASSLINGVADGRKIAEHITRKAGLPFSLGGDEPAVREEKPLKELMLKKSVRIPGIHPGELPPDNRKNFSIVTQTFTEEQAKEEASRCLLCDEVCNICTTVCPNFANVYYETQKESLTLQKVVISGDQYEVVPGSTFEIKQGIQILNIDNFCNECGNCNTFCPTQGAPYKTKPKVFLTRESFNQATDGYYLEKGKDYQLLTGKKGGKTVSLLIKKDRYLFENDMAKVELNRDDFSVRKVTPKSGNAKGIIQLEEAATLRVVLQGMEKLPFA
jgi:putative selenate reductase